jgi:hypothetical protein
LSVHDATRAPELRFQDIQKNARFAPDLEQFAVSPRRLLLELPLQSS